MMITQHDRRHDGTVAGPAPDQASAARIAALEAEVRALQEEVEQSRQILGSATEYAVLALNPEGRISSWNVGARNIFGYAEAEILGHSGEIFFTPEDRAEGAFVAELCRALDNGRAVNERWHLRKDGSRFWASGLMMPLVDDEGRPHGFLNILRDGTERQAEAERRAPRDLIQTVVGLVAVLDHLVVRQRGAAAWYSSLTLQARPSQEEARPTLPPSPP
jgi:PAS domain S-box-containing protein